MKKIALLTAILGTFALGNTASAERHDRQRCELMHETPSGNTYVCGVNGNPGLTVEFWNLPNGQELTIKRKPIDDEISFYKEQHKRRQK